MPDLDAANIVFQLIKIIADALPVGPILTGVAKPAHVLVLSMTAIAVAEAQAMK